MNKEVSDALHTLLSMALENEKYTTQKDQYDVVHKEIERLNKENKELNKENKELKNRIGRAIYFFEKTKAKQGDIYRVVDSYESNCISFILTDEEVKLLNILKGSDKE